MPLVATVTNAIYAPDDRSSFLIGAVIRAASAVARPCAAHSSHQLLLKTLFMLVLFCRISGQPAQRFFALSDSKVCPFSTHIETIRESKTDQPCHVQAK